MQKSKSRIFVGVFLILTVISGILYNCTGIMKSSAAEDYRLWRQMDSRWGSILLGDSTETMAESGCLVTCLAILAVHSGAEDPETFNPGVLAEKLNAIDAFSNAAIASWASVTTVLPDVKFVQKYTLTSTTESGKAAEMKKFMDEGYYMACKVGWHWVFIDSIIGDDVYMIDPAKKETLLFEAYADKPPTELRVFTGKNPPSNTNPVTTTEATTLPTTEPPLLGEYYYPANGYTAIYAEPDSHSVLLEYLYTGQVVEILDVQNNMGKIQLGAEIGWIEMKKLQYLEPTGVHLSGDINNDSTVNQIDLALLNEYLASISTLPDGISVLSSSEIEAADINCDGTVNNIDVLEYLSHICD